MKRGKGLLKIKKRQRPLKNRKEAKASQKLKKGTGLSKIKRWQRPLKNKKEK